MQDDDVDEEWETLKDTIASTAENLFGKQNKNQDWFDENDPEIKKSITNKNTANSQLTNREAR